MVDVILPNHANDLLTPYTESPEGLDRKFTLNFYSRMRFISNLLPLLQSTTSGFSRSLSVLSPGTEGKLNLDDLDLKNTFSTARCAAHSIVMNDFMVEEFAARAPGTTFEHTYPSIVSTTGLARELPIWARVTTKILSPILSHFAVSPEETGERQLFHATSGAYRPANSSVTAAGVSLSKELKVVEGADGQEGSGAYLVNWNGDVVYPKSHMKEYRQQGYSKIIWEHTLAVFERVEKSKSLV